MLFILVMLAFPLVLIAPWIIGINQETNCYNSTKFVDNTTGETYEPYEFKEDFDAYTSEIVNRFDYSKKYFRVVPFYKGNDKYLIRQDLITGLYYCLTYELIRKCGYSYYGYIKHIIDKEGNILRQFDREIDLYEFIAYGGVFTKECYKDAYCRYNTGFYNGISKYMKWDTPKRTWNSKLIGVDVKQYYLDMRKDKKQHDKERQKEIESMNSIYTSNLEII